MKQRTAMRCWIGYGILAVLLCSLILLNLNIGTVSLSPSEVFGILAGKTSANTAIIWEIRLPRLIAARYRYPAFCCKPFFPTRLRGRLCWAFRPVPNWSLR